MLGLTPGFSPVRVLQEGHRRFNGVGDIVLGSRNGSVTYGSSLKTQLSCGAGGTLKAINCVNLINAAIIGRSRRLPRGVGVRSVYGRQA